MNRCRKAGLYVLLISNMLPGANLYAADEVFFRDAFETLDAWEPLFFNGINRHTTYFIQAQGDSTLLVAKSGDSASALVCKQTFNVTEFPIIRWRWKVDNVYAKGNYRLKSGDDYPLRVYVLFLFDPETAGIGLRLKYGIVKTLYGRYPLPNPTVSGYPSIFTV